MPNRGYFATAVEAGEAVDPVQWSTKGIRSKIHLMRRRPDPTGDLRIICGTAAPLGVRRLFPDERQDVNRCGPCGAKARKFQLKVIHG